MRYDAYNDLSGMQSTSVALLDAQFSGIIISSIQSRDHARIYVKEVRLGDSKEKLSPEEIQVLKEAMGLKSPEADRSAGRWRRCLKAGDRQDRIPGADRHLVGGSAAWPTPR